MNKLKYLIAIAAVMGALTMSAKADLLFLGFQAFDNPNSPEHNLEVLGDFLGVDTTGFTLENNVENINGDTTITVTPGSYIVAHYGGPGGGSYEFFQVINDETEVTVPDDPNPADNLANQNSLSSVRGFVPPGGQVPDGGSTVMLLGAALGSLGMARRFLKR